MPDKDLKIEIADEKIDNLSSDKEDGAKNSREESNVDVKNTKDFKEIEDTYGKVYKNKCIVDVCDWKQESTTNCDESTQEVSGSIHINAMIIYVEGWG